jgi:hypothetical protein
MLRVSQAIIAPRVPRTHDPGIRFKYMALASVYDLSAVNQGHFRYFQFLLQRDSYFYYGVVLFQTRVTPWYSSCSRYTGDYAANLSYSDVTPGSTLLEDLKDKEVL